MAQDGLDGRARVGKEAFGLVGCVSFGHDGHVDAAVGGRSPAVYGPHGGFGLGQMADEYVARVDGVGQRGGGAVVIVAQGDGDLGLGLGIGHEEGVLEGLVRARGLFLPLPFLEEGGERGAVDDRSRGLVSHRDVAVSGEGKFAEMVAPSGPSGRLQQFAHVDGLARGVSGKGVVDAQRAVVEVCVEVLGPRLGDEEHEQGGGECSECFHVRVQVSEVFNMRAKIRISSKRQTFREKIFVRAVSGLSGFVFLS